MLYFSLCFLRLSMKRILVTILAILVPVLGFARTYDASNLPYSDASKDREIAVALSLLTDEKIVQGHPDGTFRGDDYLNRAEFMKIAMRLVQVRPAIGFASNCFPDVTIGEWYFEDVCLAKWMGIISGNAQEGVSKSKWLFEPARGVLYAEALKILVELHTIPPHTVAAGEWYESYMKTAEDLRVDLPGKGPGYRLRRNDMAKIVAAFMAYDDGSLDALRSAQQRASDTNDPVVCAPYVCSDGTTHPRCTEDGHVINYFVDPCFVPHQTSSAKSSSSKSSSASTQSAQYDPIGDTNVDAGFLLLGSTSSVLGAGKIFLEEEPLRVNAINVTLSDANGSVQFFKIYDYNGKFIGNAYLNSSVSNKTYTLSTKTLNLVVPAATEFSFYVRAVLKDKDSGGVSGTIAQLSSLGVEGTGDWSNRSYTRTTSETYNTYQTARAIITDISNAGDSNAPLISGTNEEIGSFRFTGTKSDSSAYLKVTDIVFQVASNNVSVSNVQLGADQTGDRMSCGIASAVITCASIDPLFGSFDDRSRKLTLYADITVSNGAQKASLSVSINTPGSVGSAGDITWTDGTTSFTWVEGATPVARGTYYSY